MWEKCPNTLRNESKIDPDLFSWQYIRHSFILSVWEVKFYMTAAWIFFLLITNTFIEIVL